MKLNYYDKITRFIIGSDSWLELDSRLYTKGYFKIQLAETRCIRFIPEQNNLDDSTSLDSFFDGETYFRSVLSPWSLRMIKAIVETAPDSADPLSDLDFDLITAIEAKLDPD